MRHSMLSVPVCVAEMHKVLLTNFVVTQNCKVSHDAYLSLQDNEHMFILLVCYCIQQNV